MSDVVMSVYLTSLYSAATYADNVALPVLAHLTPAVQQSIDICCLLGP